MEIALCGLPRSGKTTLWSLLTGSEVDPGGRPESRRGVVRVPDPRLAELSAMFSPKKTTPATITFVDHAAVEKGAGAGRADNPVLVDLRASDALLHVVRLWDDPSDPHPEGSVEPARDVSLLETEFLLADLEVAERRLERLAEMIQKINRQEDKDERDLLARVAEKLQAEVPLREAGLTEQELKRLRGYAFLTAKPLLLAANLPEDRVGEIGEPLPLLDIEPGEARQATDAVALSAKIEQEIAALAAESADDAAAFLGDLGLDEPALDRLIRAAYRLLGLISFFTVGEDECRAWTVRRGTIARAAAGAIHSDLERGFIRAEVIPWEALLDAGSLNAGKEQGILRLEGKEYVVADGDVMHIRHAS